MKTHSKRKFFVPILIFIILASVTVDIWILLTRNAEQNLMMQFTNQTGQITSLVQNKLTLYTNVLYGVEGLYAASQSVEEGEWDSYIHQLDLANNYAGISAMTYVQKVTSESTSTYPHVIYPLTVKSVYYPITYIVSMSSTTGIQGFDTSSDPVRWKALSTSLETGKPAASGVVPTVTTHIPSFSVYAPVYSEGVVPTTRAERTADVTGFVSVGFRLNKLFSNLASDPVFDKNIHVEIYDAPDLASAASSTLLYDSSAQMMGLTNPAINSYSKVSHIIVGGRDWTLYFVALPSYRTASVQNYIPLLTLIGGLIGSLLIAWLIYLYSSSRERAVAIADRITSEFTKSQELLKISMDNAADSIFTYKLSGKFVDVNQMACETLGYTKEELMALNVSQIFVETPGTDLATRFGMLRQQKNMIVEAQFIKKDGTVFPVESRTSIFGDDPEDPFAISIVRDISERKEAERKLMDRSAELERSNKLMVDRELMMIDLKKKLADAQGHS